MNDEQYRFFLGVIFVFCIISTLLPITKSFELNSFFPLVALLGGYIIGWNVRDLK